MRMDCYDIIVVVLFCNELHSQSHFVLLHIIRVHVFTSFYVVSFITLIA